MQVYARRSPVVQRDMDLIRQLLLRIEQDPKLDGREWIHFDPSELGLADRSPEEIGYHLAMLIKADFVEGRIGIEAVPVISKLTWEGHEFLDNIKNDNIWNKTKSRIGDLTTVSLKVFASVAEAEVKKHLGLS
jgi:Hypothetical protein (DUF2513)